MNITYNDFAKLDIRIGKIVLAEPVEGSEKLLRLEVEFGSELGKRQILSGIAKFYDPDQLIGTMCPFIVNLEPRQMMGLESQGMILAADPGDDSVVLLHPDKEISEGSKVR